MLSIIEGRSSLKGGFSRDQQGDGVQRNWDVLAMTLPMVAVAFSRIAVTSSKDDCQVLAYINLRVQPLVLGVRTQSRWHCRFKQKAQVSMGDAPRWVLEITPWKEQVWRRCFGTEGESVKVPCGRD
jgi:hypothetical protein